MTYIIGDTLVISNEDPGLCEYCGRAEELRPYGRNGARICFDCGHLPENRAETECQMDKRFEPTKRAIYLPKEIADAISGN